MIIYSLYINLHLRFMIIINTAFNTYLYLILNTVFLSQNTVFFGKHLKLVGCFSHINVSLLEMVSLHFIATKLGW